MARVTQKAGHELVSCHAHQTLAGSCPGHGLGPKGALCVGGRCASLWLSFFPASLDSIIAACAQTLSLTASVSQQERRGTGRAKLMLGPVAGERGDKSEVDATAGAGSEDTMIDSSAVEAGWRAPGWRRGT